MIRLQWVPINSVADAQNMLQTAIGVEFGTLPPYLYAMNSILPGTNAPAHERLHAIVLQEMIHMCLASNILNALGGAPNIRAPVYPGPLPGDIGADGTPLTVHLLPFSPAAMQQGMNIEQPDDPLEFPVLNLMAAAPGPTAVSIGEFYRRVDAYLATLPSSAWTADNRQIGDEQFFAGQIFPVNNYADAQRAITEIISEGEGSSNAPLDFENELAHYYRFEEMYRNQILIKADNPQGYGWGAPLGVDWTAVYPAIADPESHDFSSDPPAAQSAQFACNLAFSQMVDDLNAAFNGASWNLGNAVRSMFDLRMAMRVAFTTPLSDGISVAGPAFRYIPPSKRVPS
jgi:hypothetical protein